MRRVEQIKEMFRRGMTHREIAEELGISPGTVGWYRQFIPGPLVKTCARCGRRFEYRWRGRRKYCSDECAERARVESTKRSAERRALAPPEFVRRACARFGVPLEGVVLLYARARKELRRVKRAPLWSACFLYQAKENRVCYGTREILRELAGGRRAVLNCYRRIRARFGTTRADGNEHVCLLYRAKPLNLSAKAKDYAVRIFDHIRERRVLRNTRGAMALAVYLGAMLAGERRSQAEVAQAFGLTDVTLRNHYKEFVERCPRIEGICERFPEDLRTLWG